MGQLATVAEALLRRERFMIGAALVLICTLSWVWVLAGAGTGMNPVAMSTWQFPPPVLRPGAVTAWSSSYWLIMLFMWWVMMIAMMIPSAAPMILLYARVYRHSQAQGRLHEGVVPTASFLCGYLLAWLVFSLIATTLQRVLEHIGLVHSMMMWSTESKLTAAFMLAAGMYQLSPLKRICLSHCRSPAAYLSAHWRTGTWGALRMGAAHGLYCVGCCWFLMLLLFAGGIMNLVWIAGLTSMVLLEKIAPRGDWLAGCSGWILIAMGAWLMVTWS